LHLHQAQTLTPEAIYLHVVQINACFSKISMSECIHSLSNEQQTNQRTGHQVKTANQQQTMTVGRKAPGLPLLAKAVLASLKNKLSPVSLNNPGLIRLKNIQEGNL
jgi:hypothetical protein